MTLQFRDEIMEKNIKKNRQIGAAAAFIDAAAGCGSWLWQLLLLNVARLTSFAPQYLQ
jgi:hypothetical protein